MIANASAAQNLSSPPAPYILVVDDEPENLAILSSLLEQAGYRIDTAQDGEEALQKILLGNDYTLIVTDRIMPKLNGLELFKKIQKSPSHKHIPVIMQTGASSQDEISEGIRSGVYYYLTKPYQKETITGLVRSALNEQMSRRIFEERLSAHRKTMHHFMQGVFHVRTPQEAQNIAFLFSAMFPRPEMAAVGLYELMINAIEHGNLAIGYEQKQDLLHKNQLDQEIARRLSLPENKDKSVRVAYSRNGETLTITITDQGEGFDWRSFMDIEPSRATRVNGRGIAKANKLCFDTVTYKAKGNEVVITHHVTR